MLHPDYLQQRLTTTQINDWYSYYSLEPFGFPSFDHLIARLTAVVVSLAGDENAQPVNYMIGPILEEAYEKKGEVEEETDDNATAQVVAFLRPPAVDAHGTPIPEHLRALYEQSPLPRNGPPREG